MKQNTLETVEKKSSVETLSHQLNVRIRPSTFSALADAIQRVALELDESTLLRLLIEDFVRRPQQVFDRLVRTNRKRGE